jgi:4'-phosphopantetheinyl transferase
VARLVYLASGQLQDVPVTDDWLSEAERAIVARLKLEKRRTEWRLGRWLARQAVLAALAAEAEARPSGAPTEVAVLPQLPDLAQLAVIAAPDGAPEVPGSPLPVSLTVSHSHAHGLAAATIGAAPLGCDLELVEPRSERFINDWLTRAESARILAAPERLRPLLANLCWSAKESASKVLRVGLRFDTRSFEVELPDALAADRGARAADWLPITVQAVKTGERFTGEWRARAGFVETVLALEAFEIREG